MSVFSFRKARASTTPVIASALSEGEAFALAEPAEASNDWGAALVAIERVRDKKKASAAYHAVRGRLLARAGRLEEAEPTLKLATDDSSAELLKEVKRRRKKMDAGDKESRQWSKMKLVNAALGLDPEDAMALMQLVHELKPSSILELGSCGGGTANWLATLTRGLGLKCSIHSADWGACSTEAEDGVSFWEGDLRRPSSIWSPAMLKELPRPVLVILKSRAGNEVTSPALRSLDKELGAGTVLCVVSERDDGVTRNSAATLASFASLHPVTYTVLDSFEKTFGPYGLPTRVRCLRHTGLDPMDPAASPGLDSVRELMAKEDYPNALTEVNAIKAKRQPQRGVDYLRSLCFLALGQMPSALEAAKEELRYFSDHPQAEAVRAAMMRHLFPGKPKQGGEEFHKLARLVRPYTMLSNERLYSIYQRVRLVCQMDLEGDIVECGVAAGGASAMMAAVVAKHSRRKRMVYACDTFEGMPTPDARDTHSKQDAESSGWGSGTCAAPAGSLLEIADKLGVREFVEPVKGLFADTLPALKDKLGRGIAFLHMDGDWYESTMDILTHLYSKVQGRGFIQVDDYGHWDGCRQAMTDYAAKHGFAFQVHPIDATGVWLQRPDRKESELMLLNLGCGQHFHKEWINLDIQPADKTVIQHDLATEPLPFENGSCAAVYHSHVLEHIPFVEVRPFIDECFRVLAPDGVLRIAVPDLERVARLYLNRLDSAARGDSRAALEHEWMTIEMVDQLARHHSGGAMLEYWKQNPMPAEEFVLARMGWEVRRFIENYRANPKPEPEKQTPTAEEIGRFRLGGEVHQWMWDRVSLERLLKAAGFMDVRVRAAADSLLPDFARYELDADSSGRVRKPDSLFIEATKPS